MIDVEHTANSFGLFGSLRRFGATALSIVENRLELAAVELKEEKTRATGLAIWGGLLLFLGFMSVVALMFTVTMLFWDQRLIVMGAFCGFFIVGGVLSFFMLKRKLKTPPFAETLAQLKKDGEWLRGK